MIEIVEPYFHFNDDRGSFLGLLNFGEWREINIVTSAENTVRGNHYHKSTRELFIVLEGKIEVRAQRVIDGVLSGSIEKKIFSKNDVFFIEPMINHTFDILEPAKWINVLSYPIEKDRPDIHRTDSSV
jgi:dTDP-4-dehydrorhamnose 3,5-epimerase-like enzyme